MSDASLRLEFEKEIATAKATGVCFCCKEKSPPSGSRRRVICGERECRLYYQKMRYIVYGRKALDGLARQISDRNNRRWYHRKKLEPGWLEARNARRRANHALRKARSGGGSPPP